MYILYFFSQSCKAGTFSTTGSVSCLKCPAGYNCTLNGTLTQCEAGTFSTLGDSSCTLCPDNMICESIFATPQVSR